MNNSLIIRIEEIQQACGKILTAVDSNSLSVLTETLQIKTENKKMYISVTNREYLAKVKIDIPEDVEFLATVNAYECSSTIYNLAFISSPIYNYKLFLSKQFQQTVKFKSEFITISVRMNLEFPNRIPFIFYRVTLITFLNIAFRK